jgi:integrase
MNKLFTGKLYNQDLKNRFLSLYPEKTRRFYKYVLVKAYETERTMKKDIYDFSEQELEILLFQYNNKSVQSIQSTICVLKQYIDFCINKNYGFQLKNHLDTSKRYGDLQKYIDLKSQQYITKEDLEDIVGLCVNAQDSVIFSLLFDGIKGENSEEIVNLQIKDCNFKNNTLTLTKNNGETRSLVASDLTMALIQEAMNETEYIKNNGVESPDMKVKTYKVDSTPYVVRISARESLGSINPVNIIARINRIKMWYGNPFLTVTNIWLSGMLNELKKSKQENSRLTKQNYIDVNEKYGYEYSYWFKTKIRLEQFL